MADASRDERFMARAVELAARGIGRVEPNPAVGCVVVRDDEIVGEGYHARFGGPHAEVSALRAAGEAAHGAELYVTLEPCCHHGKTPPCTDAILQAGIRRVVVAAGDPFPKVAGVGAAKLREAGVEVSKGVLETEARRGNAAYFKRQDTGLPLVIAKWAMTLDGRIANAAGDSRWISGEASRRRVHETRRIVDAVLVGAGTARRDTPELTVRHAHPLPERGQPTRVVLDEELSIDPSADPARSARDVPVLVYATDAACRGGRATALEAVGCTLVPVPEAAVGVDVEAVVRDLGGRGMSRVLVEGGAGVFGSVFAAGLVDRLMVFVSPRILGAGGALGPVAGPDARTLDDAWRLEDMTIEPVGDDVLIQGRVGNW